MKIKAVGFDIDGTLYPDSSMYVLSLLAFLKHPVLFSHFGKVRKTIRRIQYEDDFRSAQTRLFAASLGKGIDAAADYIDRFIYRELETAFARIKPYRDLRPVLLSLRQADIRIGAMSDLPVGRKLEYLGVDDLFDFAFSTEDTGFLKPHPVPFKKLIQRFNLMPEEILYVGNNYRYDVAGAAALGIKTAHLTKKKVQNSQADVTFSSFLSLRDWIFAVNN